MPLHVHRAFILLVICSRVLPSPSVKCGSTKRGLYGTIKSPNFPSVYPDDSDCEWTISVPRGFNIQMRFTDFDLEPYYNCEYDWVLLRAGNVTLGKFCGSGMNRKEWSPGRRVIISPSNTMTLVFHSDYSNEQKFMGFRAYYTTKDANECSVMNGGCQQYCHNYIGGHSCSCRLNYKLAPDKRSCRVMCKNKILTALRGSVNSPEYPDPYPNNSDCEWTISVPQGLRITLMFEELDVEDHPRNLCPYDYVSVDGGKDHGPFCGKTLPANITSQGNIMKIRFKTDDDIAEKGFKVHYVTHGVSCGDPGTPDNAIRIGDDFRYGHNVSFKCLPHFQMIGDSFRQCKVDGNWTGTQPKCLQICGRTLHSARSSCRGRVVGGIDAVRGVHPWQVLILKDKKMYCGGSLIDEEWILTAAHCLANSQNRPFRWRRFEVVLGLHDRRYMNESQVQIIPAAEIIKHGKFTRTTYDSDVGLIRLQRKAKITNFVRPICLPKERITSLVSPLTLGVVSGWGRTDTGQPSNILQETCVPIVERQHCQKAYADDGYIITDTMYCAGHEEGKRDTCQGDSGGAMVIHDARAKRWVVAGVVSWGSQRCGKAGKFGVYSNVGKFLTWIHDTMKDA